jgi:hypothetical protein
MDNDVTCAFFNQAHKSFMDVRVLDFEKGSFDQKEMATLANSTRRLAHVIVGFRAPAAVADDQNSCIVLIREVAGDISGEGSGKRAGSRRRLLNLFVCFPDGH